jgi:hypothetical protein
MQYTKRSRVVYSISIGMLSALCATLALLSHLCGPGIQLNVGWSDAVTLLAYLGVVWVPLGAVTAAFVAAGTRNTLRSPRNTAIGLTLLVAIPAAWLIYGFMQIPGGNCAI